MFSQRHRGIPTKIASKVGFLGAYRDVANTYQNCLDINFENIPVDAAYHPTCYSRYTDKNAI